MAIILNIIESSKQIISGIPEYISVNISHVSNAIVYFTLDGSTPDISGLSLSTFIMEHNIGDPLNGTIFLPTKSNVLDLNMLAIGVDPNDVATFYRRYGLNSRNIGIGRPGIKKPILGGSAYINTTNTNIAIDGNIISTDGYTQGYVTRYDLTTATIDGYDDGYYLATSGQQTSIPINVYDHIYGYTDGNNPDGYSTTTLTMEQELGLVKLSNKGNIFVAMPDTSSSTGSKMISQDGLVNTDSRSSTIIDSNGDQIEVIPTQDFPAGYVEDRHVITDNFDDAPIAQTAIFTSGGIFNPQAAYIEIDGRIDGYINGQPIVPGDRVIINKPYGELRYATKKEDLGNSIRATMGYVSGGLSTAIYDYNKGQAAFYYWDSHDNKWVVSLQKIEAPKYEIFARRNGVVVGQVFRWVTGKRQIMPG